MTILRKPTSAGLSDPTLVRQVEAGLAQASVIAKGKPTVTSVGELILPSTTVSTTSNSFTTTTSAANNQPADTVTVYNASGAVYVSSIDQTVRQTIVKSGVSSIVAGNNITITSTGANGTGDVTINSTGGGSGFSNKITNGNSYANIASADGNLVVNVGNDGYGLWTFETGSGNLVGPGNVTQGAGIVFSADQNVYIREDMSQLNIDAGSDIVITTNSGNVGNTQAWTFGTDGTLTFPDDTVQTTAWTGITEFGEGFSLTADDKIVTNKLYSTNLTQPTQHYRLELDTNGVVVLPDGSIINGSTLRGIAGTGELNYTGITIGPNSNDAEKTWMWVDHANAYISTNNLANTWTFGIDGNLTAPGNIIIDNGTDGNIDSAGNVNINAGMATWTFANTGNLTAPGAISATGNGTFGNISTGIITLTNGAVIKDTANEAVSFGQDAGLTLQKRYAVAVGASAGSNTQGNNSVAIGAFAGYDVQGLYSVAVGDSAGSNTQSSQAIAIGASAGQNVQGFCSIAIGSSAGFTNQGNYSVAIGTFAGNTSQASNSIILNATGSALEQTTANTFTVAPVRNDTSNIAEVMFYNTTSKEVTYGNTISVTGNVTGGNVSATNITGNGGNITYQQTNTFYVDPLRTQNYTPSGTAIQPFFTISAAISAAVTAGYTDSNPAFVLLLSNITENITMKPGIFLTSFGTGTHGSPIITGTITVSSSTGSISSNHYSVSNLRIVAPTDGTCIDFTGTAPQRLFMRDVWLDANGTGTDIFMDNTDATSVLHLNTAHLAHSGTGDIYCIDLTTGNAYLTDIETSGTVQVAAVRTGTVMTIDSSEIDANNDAAIEAYGGTLTVTNSIITNAKANSNGVALNTTGSVCTLLNVLFSIPAGSGKAVFGTTTSLLYYLNVAFVPGTNTGKTASPALIATQLGTTWS